MPAQVPAEELLRDAGVRVTAIRVAVLESVADNPHSDTEGVRAAVVARLGSVAVQSVYDALTALARAQLVRRIEPAGHPARYELHAHDNHHHLACRGCGRLVDVPCAVGEMPCMAPDETHGFVIDEAEVIYWGTCPQCS